MSGLFSKGPSGNTTTTVQQTSPIAQAQLGPLSNLYGSAEWQRTNQPYDPIYLNQQYAQAQATGTAPTAAGIMPAAMQQYLNLIGRGIPSAGQAGQLTSNAADAVSQALGYSGALSGAANTALNQVPAWQNAFINTGAAANNQLQNYAANATNALTGLAPGALSGLTNLSGLAGVAGNPAEAGLYGNAAMALQNPAFTSGLRGLASGAYINPATNPAYAGMIQAATQPLVNQYQTATAPQLASQFEGAGRYGSGADINAQGQAQYGLGQGLGSAISNITNNAYNTGLNATLGAGQALGGLYNTGIGNITSALGTGGQLAEAGAVNAANILNQGYGTAGNLLNQGYTTGGNLSTQGFNALNAFMGNAANTGLGYLNAGLSGLGAGAGAAQAGYGTANTALTGAGNMLNLGANVLGTNLGQAGSFGTYPESQYTAAYNAPWLPLSNEASILGGPTGGQGTQTTSQPYYSNTGANVLGGLAGGASLLNTIGGGAAGATTGALFPGLWAGLFGSDRRIKRDIKRIGRLRNGLPVYSFRYVGSKRPRIGLMADEVEQVHPEAIIAVGPYGIKMVDYTKAVKERHDGMVG